MSLTASGIGSPVMFSLLPPPANGQGADRDAERAANHDFLKHQRRAVRDDGRDYGRYDGQGKAPGDHDPAAFRMAREPARGEAENGRDEEDVEHSTLSMMRLSHKGTASNMALREATPPRDRSDAAQEKTTNRTGTTDRSFVTSLIRRLGIPPKQLGAIIRRPARTAERYVAGSRLPDAIAFTRIARSAIGDRFIGDLARGLPLARRTAIARAALAAEDT